MMGESNTLNILGGAVYVLAVPGLLIVIRSYFEFESSHQPLAA